MMIWNAIKFLAIVLAIMVLIHLFFYYSWMSFFNIQSSGTKKIIAGFLSLFSVSMVLASILIHLFPNIVTRIYYVFASIWLGLIPFLMAASIFIWLLRGVLIVFSYPEPRNITLFLTIGLYAAAHLLVIFSLINALQIKTKNITVTIKNLPKAWEGKKIVHLSDLHLGAVWDKGFLKNVAKAVKAVEPEIIVITGDLFDGASSRHERYIDGLRMLKARQGVYFVSGNHEVYAGIDRVLPVIKNAGIRILDDDLINLDGLLLIGKGYPRIDTDNIKKFELSSHPQYSPDLSGILLYHTPTDFQKDVTTIAESQSNSYLKPETRFQSARSAGISLQLSGHTHAGQLIPFTWIADRIFNDYNYGLKKIDNFQIYISSGAGTWGPPLRWGSDSEIAVITLKGASE